jgi:hypothetical protein
MLTRKEFFAELHEAQNLRIDTDLPAVYFRADGTEYLGRSKRPDKPSKILKELKRGKVKVIVESQGLRHVLTAELMSSSVACRTNRRRKRLRNDSAL